MPGQGRLGDKANISGDAHGCPGCPHPGTGPAIQGSPDVFVNGRPALRVDDLGIHAVCCGPNMWQAQEGAPTVFINGKAAFRMNDPSKHCGGQGQLIEGSADVIVGDSGGGGGGAGGGGGTGVGSGGGGTVVGSASVATQESASDGSASSGQSGGAVGSSATTTVDPSQAASPLPHWTEFRFRDAGGRALGGARYRIQLPNGIEFQGTLSGAGVARHEQLPAGASRLELADIEAAAWSVLETEAHQSVELTIETSGLEAGESVRFEIFRRYRERSGEAIATLQATTDGTGRARAKWTPSSIDAPADHFVFKASTGGIWRKSNALEVHHLVAAAKWSSGTVREGENVTARADLHGVPDGERATIVIYEKRWRKAQDLEAKRIDATVKGGVISAQWTARAASSASDRGDLDLIDCYFTVETGALHRASDLLAVMMREDA